VVAFLPGLRTGVTSSKRMGRPRGELSPSK
jgi:hypothetical protein